jgi:hypothetical protein
VRIAPVIQPSDIHTLTEFEWNSPELIAHLEASGRPLVLTIEGRPVVVLLAVAAFERLTGGHRRATQSTDDGTRGREGGRHELAAEKLRQAFELLGLSSTLMEQNLRRDHPGASEAEIDNHLAAWRAETDWAEEAPGFIVRSPKRLAKLLRDPA